MGKKNIPKKSFLIRNICARIHMLQRRFGGYKTLRLRVRTEELPQRELNLVYKYLQGNRVTKGKTSFICQKIEGHRTMAYSEREGKKNCWLF